MMTPTLSFSAHCPRVVDMELTCMVCPEPATGHMLVKDGPNDGRCLMVLCPLHCSEEGYEDVKAKLVQHMLDGFLSTDLGPGPEGTPEVWHKTHWDPLPEHRHD